MLWLTRKTGQAIDIGDGEITLVVKQITGTKVVLGIQGPTDIPVRRKEIERKEGTCTYGTAPRELNAG